MEKPSNGELKDFATTGIGALIFTSGLGLYFLKKLIGAILKKQICKLEYQGFESVYDLDRDINEMWSRPEFKDVPGEFQGKIIITVEYDDSVEPDEETT